MIEIRDHIHKLRSFARAGRSQDYQDSYQSAIIASQMEMTSKTAKNTPLCELEAVEKIDIFEMDGSDCSCDQDEWLGSIVWEFFIQGKFIESKPKAGLSPGLPEMNRLFYKDFDSTGAINQMIKTDPHLKWSLDQAKRASLFKVLGLVVRNASLGLPQIVATLTSFCRYDPDFASRGEHINAAVGLGPSSSQSTSTPADYQPPNGFQGDTEQTDEEHVNAAVSLGPSSSQSTSTPPDYQPPNGFQGDTEQTDEEHVNAAVSLGPSSSQSTSTPADYQPPNGFQGDTEQTDEEHINAAVGLGPSSSQSTSTPPDYQPPNGFQGDTEQTDEEHINAAVGLGPSSSQSTSTPPDYQPPNGFQGDTEQTDEEHVNAAVSLGPSSSQSTSTPPDYQPPNGFQGDTEQTDEEHVNAAVGLGPSLSQSTSTPPEYQTPSDAQVNMEQIYDDHVYTTALKEMGDAEYCLPTYHLIPLCYSPPRWEAVAQYKGVRSSAEAFSKRAAKHSASKALWLQLGNSTLL